ncbi:MAG: methylenetetrahydrofolate--tRNA-(uracil(54)-C(5))-methyltransferase (FADH(2)-oxidizing) TrmFO [Actinomycetes bacterium]|jgi:methylenetetrahydrofolate--tRNA-(uracil-5-)-methyltransferase|nr:methylenetetrahydrofolate--tRNA-(uracil(54)-C(5))-methyltransferase (FADH(2)-oxidizing) TrmFO [Actinomycetes bacterium]
MEEVQVIGAGLAGSEAAWQLAKQGLRVRLWEMRPGTTTPAHSTGCAAELVCSNSLKSDNPDSAAGLLKRELEMLDSLILRCARANTVPAGTALAVDRDAFAASVTHALETQINITFVHEERTVLDPCAWTVVAAGPLASPALAEVLTQLVGCEYLSFYDAAAPIVAADSLDNFRVFAASRYGKGGEGDYLNCAMNEQEYATFYQALIAAKRVIPKNFERRELFTACQPIEEIARKGFDTLRFGALKPVGVDDPRTGRYPYALVQLRAENTARDLYNLVGFQTNLTFSEQRRVFSLIPGLERAEFLRYGVMHRNTFVDAPRVLNPDLSLKTAPRLFLAGQITGTEGYLEAAASGLIAARNIAARLRRQEPSLLPPTTALGALLSYATDPTTVEYQPMHVNFGLMPPLHPPVRNKRNRYQAYAQRALRDLSDWLEISHER